MKKSLLIVSVIAAMVLVLVLGSIAYAGGSDVSEGGMCVSGYVISHNEVPVDGTATSPALLVDAVSADGTTVSVEVGSDGYFEFADLPAGDYNFMMTLPGDWDGLVPLADRGGVAETGMTTLAELGSEDDCYGIVFKIRRLFDITVIKWEELLDGSVQPGSDWEITFDPQGDPFVKAQTDVTNGSGGVVFTVTPGSWLVSETVKDGWTPITPSEVYLSLDPYAPPGAMDPVVFKNLQPPCTTEIVVEKTGLGRDANGELVWLGPLAGWDLTLSRVDGAMDPVTMTTDASGRVTFDGLTPGVFNIEETLQNGWKAVSDNPQTVVLTSCEAPEEPIRFENEEISGDLTISGHKTYQAWTGPADGAGLSGWEITAKLVGTNLTTTTTTNALGEYFFPAAQLEAAGIGFPGATIEVCEEERDNWIPVTDACVTVSFPFPVPATYEGEVVDFVNVQDPPLPGTAAAAASGACRVSYKVSSGDSMLGIALRYGASVNAIAQASGISNVNFIRSGSTLCIP